MCIELAGPSPIKKVLDIALRDLSINFQEAIIEKTQKFEMNVGSPAVQKLGNFHTTTVSNSTRKFPLL